MSEVGFGRPRSLKVEHVEFNVPNAKIKTGGFLKVKHLGENHIVMNAFKVGA